MQETQFVRLIKRQDLNVKSVQTSIALFRCLRVAQPPTNLDPRRAAAATAEKRRVALNENPPPPPPPPAEAEQAHGDVVPRWLPDDSANG